jgi:hypothetical protein
MKKQELKKERSWLEEENKEIRGIDKKIEKLLRMMREAEE